jgi:hypothetical protein
MACSNQRFSRQACRVVIDVSENHFGARVREGLCCRQGIGKLTGIGV